MSKVVEDRHTNMDDLFSSDKFIDAVRKINKEEDDFIRDYKEEQKNKLLDLITKSREHKEALQRAKKQLKSMDKSHEDYGAFKEQVEELQRVSNGAEKERDSFIKTLKDTNQQSIINQAKESDITRRMKSSMKDSKEKLEKANEEFARSDYESFWHDALDKIEGSTEEQKLYAEQSKQKTKEAKKRKKEAEKESADSANASNYEDVDVDKKSPQIEGSMPRFLSTAINALISPEHESKSGELLGNISSALSEMGIVGKIGGAITGTLGKILDVAMASRKIMDNWVDNAANVLAANIGRINAAIEGTGKTYQDSLHDAVEGLGLNRFVKQTEYLSQIANLTTQGIVYNVEQRALLETIKDKTISSFSSMDANLLRLVRLTQSDITANQFGLEVALRNTLNKVFKDSTYLQGVYDSIASAITDAVVISGRTDLTEYSSIAQTWMGAMYESGIDSSTVNKFANAINFLGSGNVQGLASDADMQRLILLSMDTIGMDYANILQQGLSSSDITELMASIVDYLSKITDNTKNNNVLQSSYTQLFGMSMADLQGFKNLQAKMNSLQYVTASSSFKTTEQELARYQSDERVMINEQISNIFDNAKFTFGSTIAKDSSKYLAWKISNLLIDVTNSITENDFMESNAIGKGLKKFVGGVGIASELALFIQMLGPFMETMKGIPAIFQSGENGALQNYVSSGTPTMGGSSTSNSVAVTTSFNGIKSLNTLSMLQGDTYNAAIKQYTDRDWEHPEEEKNETLEEIKKITATIVESKEAKKALATYLVGMTDDTLRSFASIFADENAMQDTFQGKNNVLKDNLFNFAGDKTSNSSKTTASKSSSNAKGNSSSSNTVSGNVKTT